MRKRISTGIDVGTSSVRVVVCERDSEGSLPRVLAAISKKSRGLRHGYITNIDEASKTIREAIREAEKISGRKIGYAYAAIGGASLESSTAEGQVAVSRGDMEICEADIRRVAEVAETNLKKSINRHVIQTVPLQYKIDGKKVLGRPLGMKGEILEVKILFITCMEQHLQDLISAIESAGIMLEDVIAAPVAASFVALTKVQKMAGCVLVDIGSETVSIAIFEEGIPVSIKVFSIGSTDVTYDIALGLRIPIDEAERLKLEHQSDPNPIVPPAYNKRRLEEIVTARLSDIFELIESHLKKMGRSELLPAGVVMIGGGSGENSIEFLAKNALKLPAKVAPLMVAMVQASQNNKLNETINKKILDSSMSVAYGLCTIPCDPSTNESLGSRFVKQTGSNIIHWFKQFLP